MRPYAVIVSLEFQKVLSFSWNCDVTVPSAASQDFSRPSYFGPDSQKFSSSGLAASAAWLNAIRPNAAPSVAPKPVFLAKEKMSRISGPPMFERANRAAKPSQGQVQRGNTCQ